MGVQEVVECWYDSARYLIGDTLQRGFMFNNHLEPIDGHILIILIRNPTSPPWSLGTCCNSETHALAYLLRRRERDHALWWGEL